MTLALTDLNKNRVFYRNCMWLQLSQNFFFSEGNARNSVNVSEEEINLMKENAIRRNTNHATKFGMTLFKGEM